MLADPYVNRSERGDLQAISVTRNQASSFAKEVANDFNPLHDCDAKRFCVPGDLLFALVLSTYGVSRHMKFKFAGMVNEGVSLILPPNSERIDIKGDNDKLYLSVEAAGESSLDPQLIDRLTRSYVTFSGQTFPHVLIPLMREENVIINPSRPMVMYESMLIDLVDLNPDAIELQLDNGKTHLEVNGKRGSVCLAFNLLDGDRLIGRGEKHMLVSGLQPFDQDVVDQIISDYNARKYAYPGTGGCDTQAAQSA